MALATYSDLLSAIATNAKRTDTTDLAPVWVSLAEARINRELRVNRMLARVTSTPTDEYATVPTDLAGMRSIRLTASPYTQLAFLTPEQLNDYRAVHTSGDLAAFALVGSEFVFAPAPGADSTTEIELTYYAKIPALSASNTSNWLLSYHPDLYLWGSLVQAFDYYEDDVQLGKFEAKFQTTLTSIQAADRRDSLAANLTPIPSMTVI